MRGDFAESMRCLFTMVTWVQAASCQSLEAYTYTGMTPASSSNAAPYSKCKNNHHHVHPAITTFIFMAKKNAAWISIPALEHQWNQLNFRTHQPHQLLPMPALMKFSRYSLASFLREKYCRWGATKDILWIFLTYCLWFEHYFKSRVLQILLICGPRTYLFGSYVTGIFTWKIHWVLYFPSLTLTFSSHVPLPMIFVLYI